MAKSEYYRSCHKANCSYGHEHITAKETSIFRCRACGSEYCVPCEMPMHTGQSCTEYQAELETQRKERQATDDYLKRSSRQCPGCTIHIEKNEGCDHMTCKFAW